MAKVLIVGMGELGSRLAGVLLSAGHEVHGLRRSPLELPGVHMLKGDVTDPATLVLPAGLDYVYVILTPGESSDEAYRRIFVEGLGNVLSALRGMALRRVFFVSSSAVYAQDNGEWVDEDSPTEPVNFNGVRLLEAERLLRASGFANTTVRFAGIYGPGRLRLINWVKSGRPVVAEPPQWTNRIHIEDCVAMLAFLLEKDLQGVALAEIYNGVDDEPVPMHVVLDWVAVELKLPLLDRWQAESVSQGKRVQNRRLADFGYAFLIPNYRQGYVTLIKG